MSFGKNVAMFATLVAIVGDMPLESKILHNGYDYFAPQALPQAEGLGSAAPQVDGLAGSLAPQALPQAEGVSSFLGSAEPQALPQELGA